MNNINKTYRNLTQFSPALLTLGKPIIDDRIERFENQIDYKFSVDFIYFLKHHNGFSLNVTEVNGIGEEFLENSLDKIYTFEHQQSENPMPKEFLPFSPDGYGNYYCLDLSRIENEYCPIVFWQHDFNYNSIADVETCNDSFINWIEEVMIEWTFEAYNHDGSEK